MCVFKTLQFELYILFISSLSVINTSKWVKNNLHQTFVLYNEKVYKKASSINNPVFFLLTMFHLVSQLNYQEVISYTDLTNSVTPINLDCSALSVPSEFELVLCAWLPQFHKKCQLSRQSSFLEQFRQFGSNLEKCSLSFWTV